jgi:ADP-ribose pyrophosphatase YjhB (NUDIX family)
MTGDSPMLYRYCPRCATPLAEGEVAGLVRRYCPAPGCGFIHFVNPLPVACCLVEHAGGVVLIRRGVEPRLGYWALPAGYIEAHETTEEAARRETREECGLDVEIVELLGVATFIAPPPRPNGLGLFYLARAVGGTLGPGDDTTDARVFPLDALPPDLAFPSHAEFLARLRERGR